MSSFLKTLIVQDFKEYFPDNFPYIDEVGNNQLDHYINNALNQAINEINPNLFPNNNTLLRGVFYLSAHYLVLNMREADIGIQSLGQQIVSNKKVKDVQESYTIPFYLLQDPILNGYSTTNYGIRYLNMIANELKGNIIHIPGTTLP